jgi:hypothetical protein
MFSMVRLALQGLLLIGAIVYGVWTHFGWAAGIGVGTGLVAMVVLIFRRKSSGSYTLREVREKVAKRWVCRTCGTRGAPKSIACLNCGTNFPS